MSAFERRYFAVAVVLGLFTGQTLIALGVLKAKG